jgi:3-oxoacyl-[acyl-carrier protein] reductase
MKDKVAIVTGASHPLGMGAAAARRLAREGVRVVVADLANTENQLNGLVAEIEAAGGTAVATAVDVTRPEQIQACVEKTVRLFGRLDILFNNAGVGLGDVNYLDNSKEIWDLTFAVNVMGVMEFCRAALPIMREHGGGVIINNASVGGLGAVGGMPAPYTASKHAVIGLTKSIAQEFGKDRIRCVAICPGSIRTQMYNYVIELHMEMNKSTREEAEAIEASTIPLGYSCEASEVADVVAFLAGPAAKYITGVALPVAGGMSPGL